MSSFYVAGPYASSLKQRGFTLTELSLVLGIIGLILGAIWAAASTVSENQKVAKAVGQIQTVAGGYQDLYGQRGGIDQTTAGADVTCLGVNTGFFPADMVSNVSCTGAPLALVGSVYPVSPWQKPVKVTVDQSHNTIFIEYDDLSQNQCLDLARQLFTGSTGSNQTYQAIIDDTTSIPTFVAYLAAYGGSTVSSPLTIAEVDASCLVGNINDVKVGIIAK